MGVTVQVSVYPLGQSQLGPAIEAVCDVFRSHGLAYQTGPMSTVLEGDVQAVFSALGESFQAAAEYGSTVMALTASNACPPLSPTETGALRA
jgi:uncharacterized protein YqgV (UPF0045/DUF77 family)